MTVKVIFFLFSSLIKWHTLQPASHAKQRLYIFSSQQNTHVLLRGVPRETSQGHGCSHVPLLLFFHLNF